MKQHITFGSTPKFDTIVYEATKESVANFCRTNKKEYNGEPLDLPIVKCFGTEKIHGTNGAVCYNNIDDFWVQARNRIIDIGDDNYGCASAAIANRDAWLSIITTLAIKHDICLTTNTLTVYYEWAGSNIQGDNSAVSGLEKSAFIFEVARVTNDEGRDEWITTDGLCHPDANIYNLLNYQTYEVDLNLNDYDACMSMLDQITYEQVEAKSPVGVQFGLDNIGEGVYYTCVVNGQLMRFKHKGDLHGGKPKVPKVHVSVDDERVAFLLSVADEVTPTWRLTQAIQETNATTMKDIGSVIKFVQTDILKEEGLTLDKHGIKLKDIVKYVVDITKKYYIDNVVNKGL